LLAESSCNGASLPCDPAGGTDLHLKSHWDLMLSKIILLVAAVGSLLLGHHFSLLPFIVYQVRVDQHDNAQIYIF
jgi:hypothetical protein